MKTPFCLLKPLLTRVTRASNVGTVRVRSSNTSNLENSIDDTTNTFTGNETTGDGETVDFEAGGVFLGPEVGGDGTDYHGCSVDGSVMGS
jgi:hypothetical protein